MAASERPVISGSHNPSEVLKSQVEFELERIVRVDRWSKRDVYTGHAGCGLTNFD